MRETISIFVAAVFVLGFASLAAADDDERFKPTRKAIEESGVEITEAVMGKDFRGREALVLRTDDNMDSLVERFKELHRSGKELNGARVVGYAHIIRSDTWNITLRKDDVVSTFKIAKDKKKGCRLTIRNPLNVPIKKK